MIVEPLRSAPILECLLVGSEPVESPGEDAEEWATRILGGMDNSLSDERRPMNAEFTLSR